MEVLPEADRWWRQALTDLAFLPVAREAGKYGTCSFLAQQTAEKALKAYLFSQGEELIFTHSIFRLCDLAARYAVESADPKERVKLLDFYYVEARYPNALEDIIPVEFYGEKDADQAIAMTPTVFDLVHGLIHLQRKEANAL